jgi:hypothetical protein
MSLDAKFICDLWNPIDAASCTTRQLDEQSNRLQVAMRPPVSKPDMRNPAVCTHQRTTNVKGCSGFHAK